MIENAKLIAWLGQFPDDAFVMTYSVPEDGEYGVVVSPFSRPMDVIASIDLASGGERVLTRDDPSGTEDR